MAFTVTYDATLSRVQIAGTSLSIIDAFGRTTSNGWGSADSGQAYTSTNGAASDYSVTGGTGRISNGSVNVLRTISATLGSTDFNITVDINFAITSASGASYTRWVCARVADLSNYYVARASLTTGGTVNLEILKRSAGNLVGLTSGGSSTGAGANTGGDIWRLTFVGSGTSLTATIRNVTTAGSTTTVTGTDATLTAGTGIALIERLEGGNTNTLPVVGQWDALDAVPVGDVQRSTDQVRWSTVRGGSAISPSAGALTLDDYEFTSGVTNYYRAYSATANLTPTLTSVWLKSIPRPFLNLAVTVRDYSELVRPSKAGIFEVVGRSYPVAVTDVRGSKRFVLDLLTYTAAEASDVDILLAAGDILFIHAPATGRLSTVPTGYVAVEDTSEVVLPTIDRATRVFSVRCVSVAAPGPDVIPAVGTWQTVVNTYATWADVLAAHATWADLATLVGSPADVVVP